MRASELSWWKWFLLSGLFLFFFFDDTCGIVGAPGKRTGILGTINRVGDLLTLAACAMCALIGLIRFVKWAWKD
jgi:hypothetical protein